MKEKNKLMGFEQVGLLINELDYDLLVKLLELVKTNYNQAYLLFNEMFELYKNKNVSVIEHALFKDFTFINKKSKRLYDKYEIFFNIFDEKSAQDFLSKLNYYMSFMFYIVYNIGNINDELKEEYINQVINNLNEISKLDIDRVYLNFNHDNEQVQLSYQPKGTVKNGYLSRIYYEEENVYSDVCPTEKYETGDEFVSLFFHQPKFIIKGNRKIGFSAVKSGNFDSKEWEMIIYDFNFDSLTLPTNDDLDNTMSELDSYNNLIHDKKCDLFENEIYELRRLLNLLRTKLYDLNNLADDLEIKEALKNAFGSDFCEFDDDDHVMLETALCNQIDDFMDRCAKTLVKKKR